MSSLRRNRSRIALLLALAGTAGIPDDPRCSAAGRRGEKQQETHEASAEEAQNQEAAKHYQFGNQYFQQGYFRQAEESLRKALSVQPVYPEASYLLGLVLYQVNDFRGAIAEAERALQENPFLTEAHNVIGMSYGKMGDAERAVKEFEVVKSDISYPTPEVAHFNIGKIFWEKQACGEAVLHFRRAIDVNGSFWRAWYLLGDCQEQIGQMDLARQSYEKALVLQPSEVAPMYRLGHVCFQSRDWACARQWFMKVRELSPTSDLGAGAREYLRQLDFR